MRDSNEQPPGQAADPVVAGWILPLSGRQVDFVCPEPSNDNVDDLAPFIDLILSVARG